MYTVLIYTTNNTIQNRDLNEMTVLSSGFTFAMFAQSVHLWELVVMSLELERLEVIVQREAYKMPRDTRCTKIGSHSSEIPYLMRCGDTRLGQIGSLGSKILYLMPCMW